MTDEQKNEGLALIESTSRLVRSILADAETRDIEVTALLTLSRNLREKVKAAAAELRDHSNPDPLPPVIAWSWEETAARYSGIVSGLQELNQARLELADQLQATTTRRLGELGFDVDEDATITNWPDLIDETESGRH